MTDLIKHPISLLPPADCFIHKDAASGPKWLYLRREGTKSSAYASYYLESFVPDKGRTNARNWSRGNETVLCAAKANELGPSCYSVRPMGFVAQSGNF